jgi:hypothetical protein
MHDYSDDRAAVLEKVRPRYVYNLLAIVHGSSLRERKFIAARYAESSMHFEETVSFLEEVGWLRSPNGHVEPASDVTSRIVDARGLQRSLALAEGLFDAPGPYERLFARYLAQFTSSEGELVHRPGIEARLRDAGVRDFLMDLGAVSHRPDGDFFVLEQPFVSWALWARNVVGPSAKQLAKSENDRLALGLEAEVAVLAWERERVGKSYYSRVRHISQENPAACFDIQSVTLVAHAPHPRFIEVKAVGVESFEFHWSRAEIEAAEILGSSYFLYLLPVPTRGVFDLDRMEIVQDPYKEVYKNSAKWLTTVADTVCRKKESLAS